jgi:hypothetical protein
MVDTYVQKINGRYLAAYEVIPGSSLDQRIRALDIGAFEVADPVGEGDFTPDVDDPSPKVIYLTKDPNSSATDPYYEWIYAKDPEEVSATWKCIGTTSLNLDSYKQVQTPVVNPDVESDATDSFVDSISQDAQGVITVTRRTVQDATSSAHGLVKLGSDTVQSQAAQSVTSTVGRTYAVQKDSNGKLVVNVPWEDTSFPTFEAAHQYDASTNPAATVESITARIEALDATVQSTGGTNVAMTVTEADGIITGVSITKDDTENKNNKITSWGTPTNDQYPSAKLVKDELDTKQGSVTGTAGNFAGFDSNGNLADSGSKPEDFATAAQGALADSSVQSVKVYNSSTELNNDGSVVIPKASEGTSGSGTYGVVQIDTISI